MGLLLAVFHGLHGGHDITPGGEKLLHGDTHAGMNGGHVTARVGLITSRAGTHEIDHMLHQGITIHALEVAVDGLVLEMIVHQAAGQLLQLVVATKALIERDLRLTLGHGIGLFLAHPVQLCQLLLGRHLPVAMSVTLAMLRTCHSHRDTQHQRQDDSHHPSPAPVRPHTTPPMAGLRLQKDGSIDRLP
jgi:hypothetical protein